MSFDLSAALRRIKPQRRSGPLARRSDDALPFVAEPLDSGPGLMLDTCVYIDTVQGRTPFTVDALLEKRICNHSSIALAELAHLLGRLDPGHPETPRGLEEITGMIEDIPPRRLTVPSTRALGEAGMLAGLVARLGGYPEDRQAFLNDAILYLHAVEQGSIVLTRNLREFDFFDQLLPHRAVLFYRQAD